MPVNRYKELEMLMWWGVPTIIDSLSRSTAPVRDDKESSLRICTVHYSGRRVFDTRYMTVCCGHCTPHTVRPICAAIQWVHFKNESRCCVTTFEMTCDRQKKGLPEVPLHRKQSLLMCSWCVLNVRVTNGTDCVSVIFPGLSTLACDYLYGSWGKKLPEFFQKKTSWINSGRGSSFVVRKYFGLSAQYFSTWRFIRQLAFAISSQITVLCHFGSTIFNTELFISAKSLFITYLHWYLLTDIDW